jgi:hypothetical protein
MDDVLSLNSSVETQNSGGHFYNYSLELLGAQSLPYQYLHPSIALNSTNTCGYPPTHRVARPGWTITMWSNQWVLLATFSPFTSMCLSGQARDVVSGHITIFSGSASLDGDVFLIGGHGPVWGYLGPIHIL